MVWNISETIFRLGQSSIAERPALIHGDKEVSFSELGRRASGIASWLQTHSLSERAHVGHYMRNSHYYMEAFTGAGLAGMTHVNVNYRYVDAELVSLCDSLDIQVLVYDTEFADRIANIKSQLTKTVVFIEVGTSQASHDFAVSIEELYDRDTTDFERQCSNDDIIIIATGGTTGLPKGVMWRHEDIWRKQTISTGSALAVLDLKEHPATIEEHVENVEKLPAAKPFVPLSPLMHGAGILMSILMLAQGTPVLTVPGRKYDPDLTLDLIKKHQVSGTALVGDAFAQPLVESLDRRADENLIGDLALLISTGASLSDDAAAGFRRHNPNVILMDTLGSSEASSFALSTEVAGVFRPLPTTRVFDDAMQVVEPGSDTIGMVYSAGYSPVGYYNQPQQSAETFVEHEGVRYVKTGDRCRVREDGMLLLLGRDSTVVNTGGEKVYTVEVERVLLTHPSVDDVVVVGLPHSRFGKAVVAVVEGKGLTSDNLDADGIQNHAREQLAAYKVPRQIFAIDSLQRGENGKANYDFVLKYAESVAAE